MNQIDAFGEKIISKVKWRFIPFLFLLYFVNYLDRSNLGFAALGMNKELGISMIAYGALTSVFYLPYFLFEVPSNMLLNRYGARKWIARILITWGIVTCLAMWVHNYWQIAAVRFFLGMMEAGFLPGIMFYFTLWFPQRERARVIGIFTSALPISLIVAAPISGWILDHVHWFGYSGWRWLFMIEGIPAVILGICTLFYLTSQPSEAKWLSAEEKNWLIEEIKKEDVKKKEHVKIKEIFSNLRTWRLGIVYGFSSVAASGMTLFLPMVVKEFSKGSNTLVGFLMMLPPGFAAIFTILVGWSSDKTKERKYHASGAFAVGLIGLLMSAISPNPVVKMIGIILGQSAVFSFMPPFWALSSLFLSGTSAAVGMAIISSCNAFGSFAGGFGSGYFKSIGNNALLAYYACALLIGLILLLTLRVKGEKKVAPVRER